MNSSGLFVICPRCGDDQQPRWSAKCAECGLVWADLVGPYKIAVTQLVRARKAALNAYQYDIGPKTKKIVDGTLHIIDEAIRLATGILVEQDAED